MVVPFKSLLSLIICLFILTLFPQEKVSDKNKQLDKIKSEIRDLEREISKASKEEKKTYELVKKLNRQNYLLSRIVGNLRSEQRQLQEQIDTIQSSISLLETETRTLQENYAKLTRAIYKQSFKSRWGYLFDSESFQNAILRYKYFESFSARRKKDFKELKSKSEELIALRETLKRESERKGVLLTEKDKEEKKLKEQVAEKNKTLADVRTDKRNLEKELDEKRAAEKKIRNMIEQLIAKEIEIKRRIKQKEEEARRSSASSGKKEESALRERNWIESDGSSFAAMKGRLNWPVGTGRIIRGSGETRNRELNTVTLSYGVDIKTSGNTNVKSVADGVVSAVDYVPGFGSIVIVSHAGEYRTVYGHLSEINVGENDRVKAGSTIGTVGESLEGYILHFQIWKERNYQKPESWLSAR